MSLTNPLFYDHIAGLDGYKFVRELNSGYFGRVYQAVELATGKEWACKVIEIAVLNQRQRKNVLDEVAIMKKVHHKNIIALKEFVQTPTHYVLVMELMRGGDLFERLESQAQFMEEDARMLIIQVAEAILYLHDNGIAHRDLKIENLMFLEKDSNILKLGDFGLAKFLNGLPAKTPCGTTEYMAPEIVKGDFYSASVDIWALGCLLFILLYGSFPFYNDEDHRGNRLVDITEKIKGGIFTFPAESDANVVGSNAKDLIRKALQVDPAKRITIHEFLQHEWIQSRSMNLVPLMTPAALRTANGIVSMKEYLTVGVTMEREKYEENEAAALQILKSKGSVNLASVTESDLLEKRRKRKHKADQDQNDQRKKVVSFAE